MEFQCCQNAGISCTVEFRSSENTGIFTYHGISWHFPAWNLHISLTFWRQIRITPSVGVEIYRKWKANPFCRGVAVKLFHRRYSLILGVSKKVGTFTGLDTRRFNDVSGHRIFHAAEKVRFRKNTGPDTQCTRCVSGPRYPSIFPFFKRIRVRFE